MLVRRIKDTLRVAKSNGHALILLGCRLKLPPELEHEFTNIDFSLPGPEQLGTVLDGIAKSAKLKKKDLPDATREAALQSALGLTTTEAENAFALSVVETNGIDPTVIAREKARTLKRNGLVEVVEATTGLDDIGGLEQLKQWLQRRGGAFGTSARDYGLPAPKGLLIVDLHEAFAEGAEPDEKKHILDAITNTVPLAQLMDGQIGALRHWAKGRAREGGTPAPTRRRNGRRVQPEAN